MGMASLLGARNRPLLILAAFVLAMAAIATRPLLSQAGGDVSVFDVRAFAPIAVPADAKVPDAFNLAHLGRPAEGAKGQQDATVAPKEVASVGAAHQAVGFQPQLPAGIGAPAGIYVTAKTSDKHTFTAAEVEQGLAGAKVKAPQIAALLDGSTAVLDLPAAVGFYWGSAQSPALVLAEAPSPTLTLAGTSAATLRQALLAANGLNAPQQSVAQQVLAINDWQHALPVPVPAGMTATAQTAVPGGHGLLISGSKSGHAVSLLLWQTHGLVYALAEQGTAQNLVTLAGSVR